MFLENVGRDERQLVNGLSEFRGHASRSNGHEQIRVMAAEIYRVRSNGQDLADKRRFRWTARPTAADDAHRPVL
jgi:hypothetical protein